MLEAGNEALVGALESQLRLHAELARHIDRGEKDIAHLVLKASRVPVIQFGAQLGQFLAEFVDDTRRIRPIEPDTSGFLLDVGRADEGRECARDSVHHRGFFTLLGAFDLFPLPQNGPGVSGIAIGEDMRVTPDEFLAGVLRGLLESERAAFRGEVGVEDDLQKKISQFFAQIGVIRPVDGVDRFAGFLEQARAQRFVGLLAVPRAALGRAEQTDDGAQAGERFVRKLV